MTAALETAEVQDDDVKKMNVAEVDWLAVEFVCNGTPMDLSHDKVTLAAAIVKIGSGLPVPVIAERLGTTERQIGRVLEKHGAKKCPACIRWVMCDDGVLPPHVNSRSGYRCKQTGLRYDDPVPANGKYPMFEVSIWQL
ncbi:hypothetical protein SEA_GODPHATHER_48 [Mycobacterium phage GodPhather]|uniref:Uncharacterized protein n=1 Tax=Mycobacterium phage Jeon TaxID=2108123 RepID=A0A2P1JRI4_9CAUD|nr:hypothetical protein PQB70_gp47 [Mycobacterium phage Jeon]AVO21750.1 hypothetical protein SEA_JEON_47 [Mycobacterium phage Jeon]QBP32621.1 hypothetical protein SEA_GODPHATHER_48 [Mycobacterium phage GodPhather]